MAHSPDHSTTSSLARRYDDARLTVPLEAVGFWAAVALPVAYLPLLATGGRQSRHLAFALVAAHVLALAAGHTHGD